MKRCSSYLPWSSIAKVRRRSPNRAREWEKDDVYTARRSEASVSSSNEGSPPKDDDGLESERKQEGKKKERSQRQKVSSFGLRLNNFGTYGSIQFWYGVCYEIQQEACFGPKQG